MQLEWRDIPNFKRLYICSNFGDIISLPKKGLGNKSKYIKYKIDKDGYKTCSLSKNGERYYLRVNRVVALTFIPNLYNKPLVNHKDGNKLNNRVDNLEWVTLSENVRHAYMTGLNKKRFGKDNDKSIPIEQYTLDGIFIKKWGSSREIERELGFNHTNILWCCRGKYTKSHGFIWRYGKQEVVKK